jgi:hypothetical protein
MILDACPANSSSPLNRVLGSMRSRVSVWMVGSGVIQIKAHLGQGHYSAPLYAVLSHENQCNLPEVRAEANSPREGL